MSTSALRRALQLGVWLARTVGRLIAVCDDHRTGLVVQIGRIRVVLVAGGQWLYLMKDQRAVRGDHIRTDQKGLLRGGGDRTTLRDELVAVHRLCVAQKRRSTCRVIGHIVGAERRGSRPNNRRPQSGFAVERIEIVQA